MGREEGINRDRTQRAAALCKDETQIQRRMGRKSGRQRIAKQIKRRWVAEVGEESPKPVSWPGKEGAEVTLE